MLRPTSRSGLKMADDDDDDDDDEKSVSVAYCYEAERK